MIFRVWCLTLLAFAAMTSQISGYYVREEAAELRALVRQVAVDSQRLEQLKTAEMIERRPAQVEEWASAFEPFAPPALAQVQPSLKQALAPSPKPKPEAVRVPITRGDSIASLIADAEQSL